MEEKLKLHELSVSEVNNKDLLWLVAVKDTNDYRYCMGDIGKNHIKENEPQAVIKSGEIVWCEDDGDIYREDLENNNSDIHPFNNHFMMNYLSEDFRELTQEEKEECLK